MLDPRDDPARTSRLSVAALALAVLPPLGVVARVVFGRRATTVADIATAASELLIFFGVPLALVLAIAALVRHARGPKRPGRGLALAALGLLLIELGLTIFLAWATSDDAQDFLH